MTDNELLLAISNIMDKKLDARMNPIENRLTNIEGHMTSIEDRMTNIEGRMTNIEGRMTNIEGRMTNIENRTTNIELTLENNIVPRLQNIEACYTSTYDRYKNKADAIESMQTDIDVMKNVIIEHSEKLQKIS